MSFELGELSNKQRMDGCFFRQLYGKILLLFNIKYLAIVTRKSYFFCVFFLRVAAALIYFSKDFSLDSYIKLR